MSVARQWFQNGQILLQEGQNYLKIMYYISSKKFFACLSIIMKCHPFIFLYACIITFVNMLELSQKCYWSLLQQALEADLESPFLEGVGEYRVTYNQHNIESNTCKNEPFFLMKYCLKRKIFLVRTEGILYNNSC